MSRQPLDGGYLESAAPIISGLPLTMFCRFKALRPGAIGGLISLGVNAGSYYMLSLRQDSVGALSRLSAGAQPWAQVAKDYTVGKWHAATGVWRANNSRSAYLDGENRATNTSSVAVPAGISLRIGGRVNATFDDLSNALIADVAVWDAALTDAEVLALSHVADLRSVRPGNLRRYLPHMGHIGHYEYDTRAGLVWTKTGLQDVLRWSEETVPHRYRRIFLPSSPPSGGDDVTGSLSVTLDGATADASGSVAITGALSDTLDAASADAAGSIAISGSMSGTLDDAASDADGSVAIGGSADIELEPAALDASGSSSSDAISGGLDQTLESATVSAEGSVGIEGSASATLGEVEAQAQGSVAITGDLSQTLAPATLEASDTEQAAHARGGDDAPRPNPNKGWNHKRSTLKLRTDREFEQSIRSIYRELTAAPETRERAEAIVAPPVVERNDESPAQYAARAAAREKALRLGRISQLTVESEIALRMLRRELLELQQQDDERMVEQLLGMVL